MIVIKIKLQHLLKRQVKNTQGFTIMEALVISGILAVLITTFASYTYQRAKENKARELRKEYGILGANVKNSISQSEGLTQSEDLNFDPTLPTPTATATPTPTMAPDATPDPCPNSCTFDETTGQCNANPPCTLSNTSSCAPGCTIPPN